MKMSKIVAVIVLIAVIAVVGYSLARRASDRR